MLRAEYTTSGGGWDTEIRATTNTKNADGETEFDQAKSRASDVIVIVERNPFLRDCLHRSIAGNWPGDAVACESLSELAKLEASSHSSVVVLSIISMTEEQADAEFAQLIEFDPPLRSMVLSRTDDANEALAALGQGANGYIAMSAGFEIFVQATRFVAAGGTYVPPQCLLAAKLAPAAPCEQASAEGITNRERAVIQAIRQGKPNKVIAYELNMCESTVKVHVRHIMKKLHAKNRTDVAIKGAELTLVSKREDASAPPQALRRETARTGDSGKVRETGRRQSFFA
jgi:DNA-binding NarL/FixJ family response regulator